MRETRLFVAFVVGTFAVVGLALGLTGHVALGWARTQFLTAAGGASPGTFGPVFIALVFFQTTVTVFLTGTLLAALMGAFVGSRFRSARDALVVAGGGGGVGYYVMAASAVLVLSLVGGRGTGQTYALGQAVVPLLLSGIPATVAGAVAGVLGSQLAG